MPGSWSDFLKLRSGPAPPPSSEAGAVRVYADANGALRSVQSDGTDAAIGGGGGGGGGTVLGPYTVDWDSDPNINNDIFYLPGSATIPDGFWITDTLVEFTEEWGDGGFQPTVSMQVILEVSGVEDIHVAEWINKLDPYNGQRNIVVDGLNNDTFLPALKRQFRLDTARWSDEQGETITAAKLSMELYSNRDPFTKGQLRVWALGVQT
jgi:hypothetical protein